MNIKPTKKYNSVTKCYKIDIFYHGSYQCSTEQSKTCKQAKASYILKYKPCNESAITANFFTY